MEHPIITINGYKAIGILEQDYYNIRYHPSPDDDSNDLYVLDIPIVVRKDLAEKMMSYLHENKYKINMDVF